MRAAVAVREACRAVRGARAASAAALVTVLGSALVVGFLVPVVRGVAVVPGALVDSRVALGALAAVLGAAAVLVVAHTTRSSVSGRCGEVEVMALVGATSGAMRRPFVVQNLIIGGLGSLGAVGLLGAGRLPLLDPVAGRLPILAAPRAMAFPSLAGAVLLVGIVLTAAGTAVSLRRLRATPAGGAA